MAGLPFFRSIFILFPPFLPLRLGKPGRTGLLLARGLWLRVLGIGERLAALAGGAGESLSRESRPDWSSAGGVCAAALGSGSGVLARVSGLLASSLSLASCLGSGWKLVFARTIIGLFAFTAASLPSAVKSWPIKLFS